MQTLEDALALTFLETQLDDTIAKVSNDDKMAEIIRKTWLKMTPAGQRAALTVPMSPRGLALVQQALAN